MCIQIPCREDPPTPLSWPQATLIAPRLPLNWAVLVLKPRLAMASTPCAALCFQAWTERLEKVCISNGPLSQSRPTPVPGGPDGMLPSQQQ